MTVNIEWIDWLKMYRIYSPDKPASSIAYYDGDEGIMDTIVQDIKDNGHEIGKFEKSGDANE